jgi:hypothetical protein
VFFDDSDLIGNGTYSTEEKLEAVADYVAEMLIESATPDQMTGVTDFVTQLMSDLGLDWEALESESTSSISSESSESSASSSTENTSSTESSTTSTESSTSSSTETSTSSTEATTTE